MLVGFMAFMISETLMWVTIFSIMPVVFPVAFYQYLSRTHCPAARIGVEMMKLCSLWVVFSFGLDGLIYIAVLPLILRARANWSFFLDQTPWIWMSCATLFFLGYLARWLYNRRRASAADQSYT